MHCGSFTLFNTSCTRHELIVETVQLKAKGSNTQTFLHTSKQIDNPPPSYAELYFLTGKPTNMQEFENLVSKHITAKLVNRLA